MQQLGQSCIDLLVLALPYLLPLVGAFILIEILINVIGSFSGQGDFIAREISMEHVDFMDDEEFLEELGYSSYDDLWEYEDEDDE